MVKINSAREAKTLADSYSKAEQAYQDILVKIAAVASFGKYETTVTQYFGSSKLGLLQKEIMQKLSSSGFVCRHEGDEIQGFALKIIWR